MAVSSNHRTLYELEEAGEHPMQQVGLSGRRERGGVVGFRKEGREGMKEETAPLLPSILIHISARMSVSSFTTVLPLGLIYPYSALSRSTF